MQSIRGCKAKASSFLRRVNGVAKTRHTYRVVPAEAVFGTYAVDEANRMVTYAVAGAAAPAILAGG
jgi:hypothetical protein